MSARLIYVIGPSGAGKDSILAATLPHIPGAILARRVINRPHADGDRAHEALSDHAFAKRWAAGGFALSWQANGWCYGIPCTIDRHLAAGTPVFINGSRAALPQAQARYPALICVHITASPGLIAQRLRTRGRETPAAIAERLARNECFAAAIPGAITITNDGTIAEATAALVSALTHCRTMDDSRPRVCPTSC